MSFLRTIDQLSFTKIISIAVVASIVFAVPVAVVLVNTETNLSSRAAYVKPQAMTSPKPVPGPLPAQPPFLGRVFPWVGKVGDIVWIQGKNFGKNPAQKELKIGGVVIPEKDIAGWEDDLIQAIIPPGAKQGGQVELRIGNYPLQRSLPYVIYDRQAKVKMRKQNTILSIEHAGEVQRAIVWTGDDEIPTKRHNLQVQAPNAGKSFLFDTKGLPILTIILLDQQNNVVPYYADPIEFDF